jgi:hypothetical protein
MKLLELDGIDLRDTENYCRHIEYWWIPRDSIAIRCEDSEGEITTFKLKSTLPELLE